METVTARFGEWAQLSATLSGPGVPVFGRPIEFMYDGQVVATAETDGTGTARPSTTALQVTATPGEYPGALRARLRNTSGWFFFADEAVADLTVRKRLPTIEWPQSADIIYGTPLGPQQLNAVADVPGEFTYSPGRVNILIETYSEIRRIYLDRPLPDDPDPFFNGHSVGRWEGDTLVVDTIGISPQVYVVNGLHATEKTRFSERITRRRGSFHASSGTGLPSSARTKRESLKARSWSSAFGTATK
jgi:hypothetical protein